MNRVPSLPASSAGTGSWPARSQLVAGLVYPFWYLLTPDAARDAWWIWTAVGLAHLVPVALASRLPLFERMLVAMFPGSWLCTLQLYLLAWLNDMHVFYAVGSVMAVLSVSAALTSASALAIYGAFVSALGLGLFLLDPDPVKAACWGGVLPVVVIAHQRLKLADFHARLAEEYRGQLERDVASRTGELSEANRRLRREMEERARLEEDLRLANKLEALGRLAGGVAHEFNNLLTRIRLYAEFAQNGLAAESGLRKDIDEIQNASQQAGQLTRQMLAFSRQGNPPQGVLDLNQVVESARSMLQHLLGEGRALVVLPSEQPLGVVADRGELEQVLVNLALNARDATPGGGRVTIEVSGRGRDDVPESDLPDRLRESEYVRLSFSDTGTGMDAETRTRAFDPFFTRKSSGTGLGLSVVHGILNRAGGHVRVTSEPGKGARFDLYWLRTQEPMLDAAAAPAHARLVRGGDEEILLVEDEADLRSALERVLCNSGYRVHSSASGDAALRIATQTTAPIHLLLSDVVMPGMSGIELAERLVAAHPETKVLLISGQIEARDDVHLQVPSRFGFLAKPFDAADLIARIREVLDAPSSV